MSMRDAELVLALLFSKYHIIFHMNSCNLTFAPPWMYRFPLAPFFFLQSRRALGHSRAGIGETVATFSPLGTSPSERVGDNQWLY